MSKFGIYLNFTVDMVTNMADKICLKQRNCHLGPNLRLLETDLLELDISTAKYTKKKKKKKTFNMLCAVVILISVKISFWYLLVLYVNLSVKPLIFAPKWSISYFQPFFGGHFCYHSNGKSQSNLKLLHFGYCSNKLIRTNW